MPLMNEANEEQSAEKVCFSENGPDFVKLLCPICFVFDCQIHESKLL